MALLKVTFVLMLVSCAAAAGDETKLVQEVCKDSPSMRHGDCVDALYKDYRAKTTTDLRELTFISIDLALANSSEVVGYVGGLLEHAPAAQKPVITSCLDSLKSSRDHFRAAIGDLMDDVMTANYDCFTAVDGVTACQEAMKTANLSIPGISIRCGYVRFFSHLCYTTTNMLQG